MKSFDKLKAKLAELFQLDQADLDFGIYRIMNAKREEITRFLEHDLLPQVREAFAQYKSGDKAELQKELEEAIQQAKALGADPETLPKVKELRARLEESVDITALEKEVYDHLYNFFSRYYDEGDFISLRRYKEGVYAIPYEGEEVKLYWANHDQYYIKTTEYFRDYAFRTADGRRVRFKIAEADTEKDNIKATGGKDRRFFLHEEKPVAEKGGELVIRFDYRPDPEKRKQADINARIVQRIVKELSDEKLASWQWQLSAKAPTEKNPNRTVLEKHLSDYTKRNTFDYFIHKDLGKFLRRELDFYIKNEVMHLDDVENESAPRVEQYLSKIKVIRRIAHKIIDFLAQIENFQKKLWLKKKFVVETNYCMTLDRVPEEFYPEIAANEAQREEWVRLFAIDEIKPQSTQRNAELFSESSAPSAVKYTEPLTVEFLKANPYLVLDTRHFSEEFKAQLMARIHDLDEQVEGLLLHGEAFQCLKLLDPRYRASFDCVYIDPPYNTGNDEFIYKDNYRHSSWLTFMNDRFACLLPLANNDSALFVSIDDNEGGNLCNMIRNHSPSAELVGLIAAQLNPRGRTLDRYLAKTHEYVATFALYGGAGAIIEIEKTEKAQASYRYKDEKGAYRLLELRNRNPVFNRSNRPNLFFPIYANPADGSVSLEPTATHTVKVLPRNSRGEDGCWTWSVEKVRANIDNLVARQVATGAWRVLRKDYLQKADGSIASTKEKSIWLDKGINNENGKELVYDLFGKHVFDFPKPTELVRKCAAIGMSRTGLFMDYFAGSGTSGHAIIDMKRKDDGNRKYVLIEMADCFDSVLLPRIKKVVYSKDWRDGKPVSRDTGISHMFRYIRLESYEDALANIELKRTGPQQLLLDQSASFRESYMLKYMLETEAKGSPSLLNIDWFDDPFNYKLLVGTGSVGETKAVTVDLVETFNWLLGLRVRHMDSIRGFRIVEGTNTKGEKVLIIWRKIRDLSETDPDRIRAQREQANRDLEEFFRKQQYNTLDSEFDVIYVNGDNNLMNIPLTPEKKGLEPRYKVRLIEEEFRRLMFDVKDV